MLKCFAIVLLSVCALLAQTERGNISGLVTDSTGAVVPGASVTVTNRATNSVVKVNTTDTGEYNVAGLSPGEYNIEITADGFRRTLRSGAQLTASATLRIDAQLQLGAVSETVEVNASGAQVQTENARVSTSVSNVLVDTLPLVVGGSMRTPLGLVTIAPEARGSGGSMRLGGGQGGSWNATLDGISVGTNRNMDVGEVGYNTPSVEAITEFTVDTNGFKAEYGQAGGGVMTFVSRSGTNTFHGGAFDYLRNEKLDSRGFFATQRNIYKQNDFGAFGGAPIYIPKLYNGRDRSFFFISYEGFRNRVGSSGNIMSIPTPEMFTGDFSKWVDQNNALLPIFDPFTTREASPGSAAKVRTVYAGNQIPASQFAAFSKAMIPIANVVKPNRGGNPGTTEYVRNNFITTSGTNIHPSDKMSVKIDHNINPAHKAGFTFNWTDDYSGPGAAGPPGLPLPLYNGQYTTFNTKVYRFNETWTISPRMLNAFNFGYNHFYKDAASPNAVGGWKAKGICLKSAIDCDVNMATVQFGDTYTNWGTSANNGTGQPLASIKNDTSYFRGKHIIKFGYNWDDQHANGFGQQDIGGRVVFNRTGTAVPGSTVSNTTNGGNAFASFLLGWVNNAETETARSVPQFYVYHGLYVQDDWRITPKLTVNFGLRYDLTLPPVSANDIYSDFTPDRPNPAVNNYPGALRFAGFGEGRENTRSLVPGWYKGFAPRLSIAYSYDQKTSIRAGIGRSFSRVTVVASSGHYDGSAKNYTQTTGDNGITPAFLVDVGPGPYILPPFTNPSYSNNNDIHYWQPQDASRPSETYFWTFSIQRQISGNFVLDAAYNATAGSHLQTGLVNVNQTPTPIFMAYVNTLGAAGAVSLMNADINSAAARNAGVPIPYANFTNPAIQTVRSVKQALRPFPQYANIIAGAQGGDRSGHSSYHALVVKADRRFSKGLSFNWNYVLSKLVTDSENVSGVGNATDQYNRRLEKGLAGADQTHVLKMSTVYELPFMKKNRFLGGWRISGIQVYNSGTPLSVSRNNAININNGGTRPWITTYENWRAPISGEKFDPAKDKFLDRTVFPATQPSLLWGNETRVNPKVRNLWGRSENISMAKTFRIKEQFRADFRFEAFNIFNRHTFSAGGTNLDSNTFGVVTSAGGTREAQVALKLYW